MTQTNIDVLNIIASYYEPHPIEYTRLATINRDFYLAFTSDKLWKRYDAYGVGKGIFSHFIASARGYQRLIIWAWWHPPKPLLFEDKLPWFRRVSISPFEVARVANKYVQLGYYQRPSSHVNGPALIDTSDPILIALLLDAGMFERFSPDLKTNPGLIRTACRLQGKNLGFINWGSITEELLKDLVDATKMGGDIPPPNYATNILVGQELLGYALDTNPAVVQSWLTTAWDPLFDLALPLVGSCRQQILTVFAGLPQFIKATEKKWWKDREVCQSVFGRGYCQLDDLPREFLLQCQDEATIKIALENHPQSIFLVSQRFRLDTELVSLAFSRFQQPPFEGCYLSEYPQAFKEIPWSQGGVVKALVENRLLTPENFGAYPQNIRHFFGEIEWVKDWIVESPWVWNMASLPLQENRELLLWTLKIVRDLQLAPKGHVRPLAYFDIPVIPQVFYRDKQVLEKAAEVGSLGRVAGHELSEEIIGAHLAARGTLAGLQFNGDDFYETRRDAILKDHKELWHCCQMLGRFYQDPLVQGWIDENRYEVSWFENERRRFARHLGSPNIYMGALVDWYSLDREAALRLLRTSPRCFFRYAVPRFGEGILLEALEVNGFVFEKLERRTQLQRNVQMSIGPLNFWARDHAA